MIIKEHDASTGEIIEREMTIAEIAQWETDKATAQTELAAKVAKSAEKAALLAQLGINEDQAKLLLS